MTPALHALAVLALVAFAGLAVRRLVDATDAGRRWGAELDDQYHEGWRER